jgi:hypothetical protein
MTRPQAAARAGSKNNPARRFPRQPQEQQQMTKTEVDMEVKRRHQANVLAALQGRPDPYPEPVVERLLLELELAQDSPGQARRGDLSGAGGPPLEHSVMAQQFMLAGRQSRQSRQTDETDETDAPRVQAELLIHVVDTVDRMHKLLEELQGRLEWVLDEAEQPKVMAMPAEGQPVASGRRSRLVQELRAGSERLFSLERRLKELLVRVKL